MAAVMVGTSLMSLTVFWVLARPRQILATMPWNEDEAEEVLSEAEVPVS
jgi:hypothetical protein